MIRLIGVCVFYKTWYCKVLRSIEPILIVERVELINYPVKIARRSTKKLSCFIKILKS